MLCNFEMRALRWFGLSFVMQGDVVVDLSLCRYFWFLRFLFPSRASKKEALGVVT